MSDITVRLLDYSKDDHERGCQGRCYDCTCGYDDKRDPLLKEAAARIEQLEAEADEQVQWVKDLADLQIKAEARIAKLEAALKPLCCTCDRAASDECSRAEVDCPFWNARAALGEDRT